MSLTFALAAAVNGTTGLRAILLYGLVRTTLRRRRPGQHPGFSRRTGGRASGQEHSYACPWRSSASERGRLRGECPVKAPGPVVSL
jgi:hypothetical protein